MKIKFSSEIRGDNKASLPVYCEVEEPGIGGRKLQIKISVVPCGNKEIPTSPCNIYWRDNNIHIAIKGIYWKNFPIVSHGCLFKDEPIGILHIEKIVIERKYTNTKQELRFHLSPISYLRSEANMIPFGGPANSKSLFTINLPNLGMTEFMIEWITNYNRDTEMPSATVIAGFCAAVNFQFYDQIDPDKFVIEFKKSLVVLSVLFRQAVQIHGWTSLTKNSMLSTWINPIDPSTTPSAREDIGPFVVRPQLFVVSANDILHAYNIVDVDTKSIIKHLSVAVNPYIKLDAKNHFLFMFSALERLIEFTWKYNQPSRSSTDMDNELVARLEELKVMVANEGGQNASIISDRLDGFIKSVRNGTSFKDKLEALFHKYPALEHLARDLWPIIGSGKKRGLRDIRHALVHGRSSYISSDVVSVAEWHLAIFLERVIFIILGLQLPDGISPKSFLLTQSGRGCYHKDLWEPLRCKPDQPI